MEYKAAKIFWILTICFCFSQLSAQVYGEHGWLLPPINLLHRQGLKFCKKEGMPLMQVLRLLLRWRSPTLLQEILEVVDF